MALRKYEDRVPSLAEELVLPAHRLSPSSSLRTLEPVRGGEGEHEQGEHPLHPHRPVGFLRLMAQLSLLPRFLQHGPLVQPIYPIDDLLAVQAADYLPTQPLGQFSVILSPFVAWSIYLC
jgi:hypothetical protein